MNNKRFYLTLLIVFSVVAFLVFSGTSDITEAIKRDFTSEPGEMILVSDISEYPSLSIAFFEYSNSISCFIIEKNLFGNLSVVGYSGAIPVPRENKSHSENFNNIATNKEFYGGLAWGIVSKDISVSSMLKEQVYIHSFDKFDLWYTWSSNEIESSSICEMFSFYEE